MTYDEIAYWNSKSYGSALTIEKKYLHLFFVFFCIVTPFTNWMIPFTRKMIRKDLIFRF